MVRPIIRIERSDVTDADEIFFAITIGSHKPILHKLRNVDRSSMIKKCSYASTRCSEQMIERNRYTI
jgi:hypothetical protein